MNVKTSESTVYVVEHFNRMEDRWIWPYMTPSKLGFGEFQDKDMALQMLFEAVSSEYRGEFRIVKCNKSIRYTPQITYVVKLELEEIV